MVPPTPSDESQRLETLRHYRILDTPFEPEFDGIVTLAAQVCGTPIALISFIDAQRQWIKARVGMEVSETPRDISFCAYTILQHDVLVANDPATDPRFAANPFVVGEPRVGFYAGAPLIAPDGSRLGALCVIDKAPRGLNSDQSDALQTLSREVVSQLELRKAKKDLNEAIAANQATESALRASDQFKSRLVEGSQDCIKVLDLNGRLLSMNSGGMKTLEICKFEEFQGQNWLDFWHGRDRAACEAALDAARKGGAGRFVGFFATAVTRKPMWFDVVVNAILDKEGHPERLLAISRDVTEAKHAEDLLRTIIQGTAPTTGAEFFRSLVRCLAQGLHVRFAFVAECLPQLRARSLAYWNDGDFGGNFEYGLPGTPCMEVSKGRVCHIPDRLPEAFPEDKGMIDLGTVSYLGVPLYDSEHRTIGHLVIFHDQPLPADPLVLSVMETFAARAGAELERKRAEERERAILEVNNAIISNLTQDELLAATAAALKRVVPFDRAALTLHDPKSDVLRLLALEGRIDSKHFVVGLALTRQDSHVGWVFDHQRTLLRRDLEAEREFGPEHRLFNEGVRSMCTAPFIVAGKSIGTITVGSNTANQYTEADAAFLQKVANQIALAVSNMRAFEEIAELKARLQEENLYLQEEIRDEHNFDEIVGNSPALINVLRDVERVAPTQSTVLILGETGTGKELIARAIHDRSPRKGRPLVKVNCGAISAGLVESELFGHVKGAFTGALANRDGRFRLADGGAIFLDEVGELPPETQVKLLRVLQEQEFEPIGSSRTQKVNVRVIAATNRDLSDAIRAGKFRADLFYRLNVFPVRIPALRERREDIPLLAAFFLQRFAQQFGKPITRIPDEVMRRLTGYDWPGNIRELQNVIERAAILSPGRSLTLAPDFGSAPPVPAEIEDENPSPSAVVASDSAHSASMEEMERRHIESVLHRVNWMIEGAAGAAKLLDLSPSTLRSRMQKLGIKRPGRM